MLKFAIVSALVIGIASYFLWPMTLIYGTMNFVLWKLCGSISALVWFCSLIFYVEVNE